MEPWLLQASHDLPPTYEQVGSGPGIEFRRTQSDLGMSEEEAMRWRGRVSDRLRRPPRDRGGTMGPSRRREALVAEDVKPWPARVRYPLIAVFAAVVLVGLGLAVTSGVDSAVVRIVIAAVLIPALLASFQVWGLHRRSQRLAPRLAGDLERLQARIAQERDVEQSRRTSGASDQSLIAAADAVAVARNHLAAGDEREAAERVRAISQPWAGDLGDELARCRASAGTITRTDKRADDLRR